MEDVDCTEAESDRSVTVNKLQSKSITVTARSYLDKGIGMYVCRYVRTVHGCFTCTFTTI